jgi:oleate hydratase
VEKKSAYIIGDGSRWLIGGVLSRPRWWDERRAYSPFGKNFRLRAAAQMANKGPLVFYMRGGREMDNHFECMWDLFQRRPIHRDGRRFRSSTNTIGSTRKIPTIRYAELPRNAGKTLTQMANSPSTKKRKKKLTKLFLTPEKDLEDKKISDIFDDHFWKHQLLALLGRRCFAFQRLVQRPRNEAVSAKILPPY